jgi:hypothetical protein
LLVKILEALLITVSTVVLAVINAAPLEFVSTAAAPAVPITTGVPLMRGAFLLGKGGFTGGKGRKAWLELGCLLGVMECLLGKGGFGGGKGRKAWLEMSCLLGVMECLLGGGRGN